MKTTLSFLIPPLAGAVIGFITNVIAIKMLFRPLREIRVFGFRLPFTPGILPRQRHKLAESIGAMVERELLTPEIIRERLQRDEVKGGVEKSVSLYTEQFLSLPLGTLLRSPSPGSGEAPALSFFQGFADSPVWDEIIAVLSQILGDDFIAGDLPNRSLNEILGPEGGAKMRALAEGIIGKGLESGPEEVARYFSPLAEEAYPRITQGLIRFLNRSDVHRQMEEQGRIFLTNVILKLNVFQRFFISTAQYDRTLHERMPEIVDDLIVQLEALLEDGDTRGKILLWGRENFCRLLSAPGSPEKIAGFISAILAAQMDKPLGAWTGGFDAREIKTLGENILRRIKNHVFSKKGEGAPSFFKVFSEKFLAQYGEENLSRFLSVTPEKKAALDSLIAGRALRIADEQIGAALGTINVRSMVAERINSLDMVRVERIILDLMADQLKWIDVFGAFLGFFIGLFQSLSAWFLR
jgi:hypothetical protein